MRIYVSWKYSFPNHIETEDGEIGIPEEWDVEEGIIGSKVYDEIHSDLKEYIADEIESVLGRKPIVELDGGVDEATLTIDNRKISDQDLRSIMKEATRCFADQKYEVKADVDLEATDDHGSVRNSCRKIEIEVSPCSVHWKNL